MCRYDQIWSKKGYFNLNLNPSKSYKTQYDKKYVRPILWITHFSRNPLTSSATSNQLILRAQWASNWSQPKQAPFTLPNVYMSYSQTCTLLCPFQKRTEPWTKKGFWNIFCIYDEPELSHNFITHKQPEFVDQISNANWAFPSPFFPRQHLSPIGPTWKTFLELLKIMSCAIHRSHKRQPRVSLMGPNSHFVVNGEAYHACNGAMSPECQTTWDLKSIQWI